MVAPQPPPAASLMSQCRAATSPDQTGIPDPRSNMPRSNNPRSNQPLTRPAKRSKRHLGGGKGANIPDQGGMRKEGLMKSNA